MDTAPTLHLAALFEAGQTALMAAYGNRLKAHHLRAMNAMLCCRTGALGHVLWRCPESCSEARITPRSCGHRSCPLCQNHTTTEWLARQRDKLLPVDYFMLTFTLPAELRPLAQAEPHAVYAALFSAASDTIKGFGTRKLKAELGQCAVLHTHNRRLDLHPHVHIIVPGGGIDAKRKQWKKLKGKYLFNAFALAKVFRAKLLHQLSADGLAIPVGMPKKWVVDCCNVGNGEPALKYLSRYLYRGVIREKDLCGFDAKTGIVRFRYLDASTKRAAYRQLPIEDFLWRVLQHVLPPGLRRVRDYGFLHGKAKLRLKLVQLVLRVMIKAQVPVQRPVMCCPHCQRPMQIVLMTAPHRPDG
jgi:Putative transposase/Transposase zinc-binding domain